MLYLLSEVKYFIKLINIRASFGQFSAAASVYLKYMNLGQLVWKNKTKTKNVPLFSVVFLFFVFSG